MSSEPDIPDASTTHNRQRKRGKSCGVEETRVLIEVWGESYAKLKGSSNANKKKIWNSIKTNFEKLCRTRNVDIGEKDADKLKKRIQNLEYEYRQKRARMCTTGEEGAKKIKGEFTFFDEMDDVLGCREGSNPERMSVESTALVPVPASSEKEGGDDGVLDSPDANRARIATVCISEATPTTSGTEQASETTPSPPAPGSTPSGSKGSKKVKASLKRKRQLAAKEEDDPYMAQVCGMWKEALAKQEERFQRTMELQEKALESQTSQTKMLVEGMKDMIKEIMK